MTKPPGPWSRFVTAFKQELARQNEDAPLLWAWSMNAVLNGINGVSNDIYSGHAKTPENHAEFRQVLTQWWGVHDRDGALQTIRNLSNMQMGQAHFEEHSAPLIHLPDYKLRSIESNELGVFDRMALENRDFLRLHGVKGWDLTRAQGVIAWAWLADWITQDEARNLAVSTALRAQQEFDCWGGLGLSYLLGYAQWNPDPDDIKDRLERVEDLGTDPQSAWARRPWNTPLA